MRVCGCGRAITYYAHVYAGLISSLGRFYCDYYYWGPYRGAPIVELLLDFKNHLLKPIKLYFSILHADFNIKLFVATYLCGDFYLLLQTPIYYCSYYYRPLFLPYKLLQNSHFKRKISLFCTILRIFTLF